MNAEQIPIFRRFFSFKDASQWGAAQLEQVDLTGCSLDFADLSYVALVHCDLSRASLKFACLHGLEETQTTWHLADRSGCVGTDEERLEIDGKAA